MISTHGLLLCTSVAEMRSNTCMPGGCLTETTGPTGGHGCGQSLDDVNKCDKLNANVLCLHLSDQLQELWSLNQ